MERRESIGEELGGLNPQKTDDNSGGQVRKSEAKEGATLKWRRSAGIPSGKTDELVDEAQWNDEDGGVQPSEFPGYGHQIDENSREWSPRKQVNAVAVDRCKKWMHRDRLVVDLHAS